MEREELREMGVPEHLVGDLAGISALIQTPLDMFQAEAIMKGFPGYRAFKRSAMLSVKKAALGVAVDTGIVSVAETGTEVVQNLVDPLMLDIVHEFNAAVPNGDEIWADWPEEQWKTFLAIAPLALLHVPVSARRGRGMAQLRTDRARAQAGWTRKGIELLNSARDQGELTRLWTEHWGRKEFHDFNSAEAVRARGDLDAGMRGDLEALGGYASVGKAADGKWEVREPDGALIGRFEHKKYAAQAMTDWNVRAMERARAAEAVARGEARIEAGEDGWLLVRTPERMEIGRVRADVAATAERMALEKKAEWDARERGRREELRGRGDAEVMERASMPVEVETFADAGAVVEAMQGKTLVNESTRVPLVLGDGKFTVSSEGGVSEAARASALANFGKLWENAEPVASRAEGWGASGASSVHLFEAPMIHGGEVFGVGIGVRESVQEDGGRVFSFEGLEVRRAEAARSSEGARGMAAEQMERVQGAVGRSKMEGGGAVGKKEASSDAGSEGYAPWREDFPKITSMVDWKTLRNSRDYNAAKAGDRDAAARLVPKIAQSEKVKELARRHPEAVVVAVHAEERSGRNRLPSTYADYIGSLTGLEVDKGIAQTSLSGRTGKDAYYRLANRATFEGPVQAGREYILVDDVAAQGGTLNELRAYIERKGGKVVDVTTLAASNEYSAQMALTAETKAGLEAKYGDNALREFLLKHELYNGDYTSLTESEAGLILRAASLDEAGNRIAASRQRRNRPVESGVVRQEHAGAGEAEGGVPARAGGAEAAAKAEGLRGRPGNRLGIKPSAVEMTAGQRAAETRFAEELNRRTDAENDAKYNDLTDSQWGRVLGTDIAREMSADYLKNPGEYTHSTSNPAAYYVNERYFRELKREQPGDPLVQILAGGPGSGKSSSIRTNAQIVYDTTLSDFNWATKNTDAAVDSGRFAQIVYVHCPVEKARGQASARTEVTGRIVPSDYLGRTHFRSQQTILKLAEHYKNNPKVEIQVVDNSGAKGEARIVPEGVDFLRKPENYYTNEQDAIQRAISAERGRVVPGDKRLLDAGETGGVQEGVESKGGNDAGGSKGKRGKGRGASEKKGNPVEGE